MFNPADESIMRMRFPALLCVALSLSNATMAEEAVPMTGDVISSTVKGKRLAGERTGGGQVRVKFGEDGSLSIQDGHAVLTGKWSVQGDKLCMQVAKWNLDGCGRMDKAGNLITQYDAAGDKAHIVFGK